MTDSEKWVDIKGYEGLYQVSNMGDVKRLYKNSEKLLAERVSTTGYDHKSLWKDNKRTNFKTHRLVALAFIENPKGKYTVNHIDGNKLNNNVTNLEWLSLGENLRHARDTGLWQHRGSNHVHAKLTEEDVYKIRDLLNKGGITMTKIGTIFGVGAGAISKIANGDRWGHLL